MIYSSAEGVRTQLMAAFELALFSVYRDLLLDYLCLGLTLYVAALSYLSWFKLRLLLAVICIPLPV